MTGAPSISSELSRVAGIATVIVDGDEASRILTDDAIFHLVHENTQYRFLSMDHYNVHIPTFQRMKKLLLRLERLSEIAVNCSLWVPLLDGDRVTLVVQNGNVNRYYRFGQKVLETPDAMRRCFENGVSVSIGPDEERPVATVLAPVFNSLDDVSAVLELSAATREGAGSEYA
jgi:hypothetical protein